MTDIYYNINHNYIDWVEKNYWTQHHNINYDEKNPIVNDIIHQLDTIQIDGQFICDIWNFFTKGNYSFFYLRDNEQDLIDVMKSKGYNFIHNPDIANIA